MGISGQYGHHVGMAEETVMFWKQKTAPNISSEMLSATNTSLAEASPPAIIAWAASAFGSELCLATMLDAEGCVLVAMTAEQGLTFDIVMPDTLDTPMAAFQRRQLLQQRYGLSIRLVRPSLFHASFESDYGGLLWSATPAERLRRWEPLRAFLCRYQARISARRRDMFPEWNEMPAVQWDESFNLVQVNPLAQWTTEQVQDFLQERKLDERQAQPQPAIRPA